MAGGEEGPCPSWRSRSNPWHGGRATETISIAWGLCMEHIALPGRLTRVLVFRNLDQVLCKGEMAFSILVFCKAREFTMQCGTGTWNSYSLAFWSEMLKCNCIWKYGHLPAVCWWGWAAQGSAWPGPWEDLRLPSPRPELCLTASSAVASAISAQIPNILWPQRGPEVGWVAVWCVWAVGVGLRAGGGLAHMGLCGTWVLVVANYLC